MDDVQFYWNGSFIGTLYHMTVNGNDINLGVSSIDEQHAKEEAVIILERDYQLVYSINDIEFKFGGQL